MKAYLDNDVVSAIGKGDVSASELSILRELLDFFKSKRVDFVTSKVIALEISRYKGPKKPAIEQIHASLTEVPFVEDHEVLGFQSSWNRFGGESYPLVADDAITSALRKMRLERTDAHHLMLAIRAGCDRFITYDKRILGQRTGIESAFSIKVMRPSELLAELYGLFNSGCAATPTEDQG